MAVSFTRPDPSSPASIAEANFGTTRKVSIHRRCVEFPRRVAGQMAHLQEVQQQLEAELSRGRSVAPAAPEQIDEATCPRLLGEETARIGHAPEVLDRSAHRPGGRRACSARQPRRPRLGRMPRWRRRRRSEARAVGERDQRRQGAGPADGQRGAAPTAGASSARLARRRNMARDQIDQLVHHRDQLLRAFIHARDVEAA